MADAPDGTYHKNQWADGALPTNKTDPLPPNTILLKQYWSPTRKDMMLTASNQGQTFAAANNFTELRTEGFLYVTKPAAGSYVKVDQWLHPSRKDAILIASPWYRSFVQGAGYTHGWDEGWLDSALFPPTP